MNLGSTRETPCPVAAGDYETGNVSSLEGAEHLPTQAAAARGAKLVVRDTGLGMDERRFPTSSNHSSPPKRRDAAPGSAWPSSARSFSTTAAKSVYRASSARDCVCGRLATGDMVRAPRRRRPSFSWRRHGAVNLYCS